MLWELAQFTLVGVVSTAAYFAVAFWLEHRLTLFWTIFWAFWISLPIAYVMQRGWVFDARVPHTLALPRFILIQVIGLGFNQLAANAMAAFLGAREPWQRRAILASAYLASALATYLAAKFWVFAG